VLLGDGIRVFDNLARAPSMFDDPEITEGDRLLHLRYLVRR
jgi:hypothetical protein